MNKWECEECDVTAVGIGCAAGLIAIGWYFELGPKILCPTHHPNGFSEAKRIAEGAQAILREAEIVGDLLP